MSSFELQSPEEAQAWPFSRAALTAGLRRYLGDTSLRIADAQWISLPFRQPAIGRIRGMLVEYEGKNGGGSLRLVIKEPRGTTRTGLAGAGRREVGFYRTLASHVPLPTPDLVAYSQAGDWLALEQLRPARSPSRWTTGDYREAIRALAELHDRFWGLREDLQTFPWLSDPLGADFDVHVTAAAKAIARIQEAGHPEPLAGNEDRMALLAGLASEAERVVQPLRDQPGTLLHGDYWPGNIAILADDSQVVYDWQLTGIGPGAIDLLVFLNKSDWWYGPLPVDQAALVDLYREELGSRNGVAWSKADWELLWDHALMWRFLQEWLDLLAASPDPVLAMRAEQLDHVWLRPVEAAVSRRLSGMA